jgi:ABC-type multidrug transport system fused ATPase/permease subunit
MRSGLAPVPVFLDLTRVLRKSFIRHGIDPEPVPGRSTYWHSDAVRGRGMSPSQRCKPTTGVVRSDLDADCHTSDGAERGNQVAETTKDKRRFLGRRPDDLVDVSSSVLAVAVAAVITLLFLAGLGGLIVWLSTNGQSTPLATLPMQFVAAVVLLVLVICILTIVFKRLELSDKTRAMGLPDGSVRAIIALLLIMLFFLIAVFLFQATQEHPDPNAERSLNGITAERLSGIPTDQILSMTSRTEGQVTVYDVKLSSPPTNTAASTDIAKQLITIVATLVTAVSAFYFGANTATSASSQPRDGGAGSGNGAEGQGSGGTGSGAAPATKPAGDSKAASPTSETAAGSALEASAVDPGDDRPRSSFM